MSSRQVMEFQEQGLLKHGARLGHTCLLHSVEGFAPTDASMELYEWVQEKSQVGGPEEFLEIYNRIVTELFNDPTPPRVTIQDRECYLGGEKPAWYWSETDQEEYGELMQVAHKLGHIVTPYVADNHVIGLRPMQSRSLTRDYWITVDGWHGREDGQPVRGLLTQETIWEKLHQDVDGLRYALVYPSHHDFKSAEQPST